MIMLVEKSAQQNIQLPVPVENLLRRYPYLYKIFLTQSDPALIDSEIELDLAGNWNQFEVKLSRYVLYRTRQAYAKLRHKQDSQISSISPVKNPTLLRDRKLQAALRHFAKTTSEHRSYWDLANYFVAQLDATMSYYSFKQAFCNYMRVGIGAEHRLFLNILREVLVEVCVDHHDQPVNDFLRVRTCRQLMSCLFAQHSETEGVRLFTLINTLGPILTVGILIKILLICPMVKPYLDRQLLLLFKTYQTTSQPEFPRLIELLEYFNIALSLNFGTLVISSKL